MGVENTLVAPLPTKTPSIDSQSLATLPSSTVTAAPVSLAPQNVEEQKSLWLGRLKALFPPPGQSGGIVYVPAGAGKPARLESSNKSVPPLELPKDLKELQGASFILGMLGLSPGSTLVFISGEPSSVVSKDGTEAPVSDLLKQVAAQVKAEAPPDYVPPNSSEQAQQSGGGGGCFGALATFFLSFIQAAVPGLAAAVTAPIIKSITGTK